MYIKKNPNNIKDESLYCVHSYKKAESINIL